MPLVRPRLLSGPVFASLTRYVSLSLQPGLTPVTDSSFLFSSSQFSAWRKNFLRVGRLVLIGGPDDGVITPWQSR